MISKQRIEAFLARFALAAVVSYFAVIVALVFITMDSALHVLQRRDDVTAAADLLRQIEVRDPARAPVAPTDARVPAGSPFLEGATASVAGAALLQRVAVAIKRASGNTLSSQVDLKGTASKTGFITATSSFEIDPIRLQPLLYDLEAGMPFLFVDELAVQAPSGSAEGGKLRVLLGVSAQRQSSK